MTKPTPAGRGRIPHLGFVLLSLGAAVVSVALKFAAFRMTNSVGLFSDAVESLANVVAALTALFALWYGARPDDRTHPYGHQKIEFFASGIEGGLILVAAVLIVFSALHRLAHPLLPEALGAGMALVLISTAINFLVGYLLLKEGRRVESIVLEADGHHLMTDVWTTIGVVVGLLLVLWTKQPRLDSLLAILVAANIVRVGLNLVHRSFDGLMDHALAPAEDIKIRAAIEEEILPGMKYHALRTRRSGNRRFADYHLLVPGKLHVKAAHDCEVDIGQSIQAAVPGIEINAHIEPLEEPLAYTDHDEAALDLPRFEARKRSGDDASAK
jgi:cation diffusion facilitator family transporter